MIAVVNPAERRMLANMIEASDLIPEQLSGSELLPAMGFRGRSLGVALSCVEKGLLINLGNARFRMTPAGVAASNNSSPSWWGRG